MTLILTLIIHTFPNNLHGKVFKKCTHFLTSFFTAESCLNTARAGSARSQLEPLKRFNGSLAEL